MPDCDDPTVEAAWNAERRAELLRYLAGEGLPVGLISDAPAWSVAPYASLWSVESSDAPGRRAWWAICGDMPSDWVAASEARNAREAVEAIASLWAEAAELMARGERHPKLFVGSGGDPRGLAPLLASRAALLLEWVDDPEAWDDEPIH